MDKIARWPVEVSIESRPSIEKSRIEIVELKGIGHPDSLADGISEAIARLFHSTSRPDIPPYVYSDKVLITPGEARPGFEGGTILRPFHVYVPYVSNQKIPSAAVREAVYQYLEDTLRYFLREHARITVIHRKPSQHSSQTHRSFPAEFEDTAIAVAYAPLTTTECLVKDIHALMTSKRFKEDFLSLGEDVKLLACRQDDSVKVTLACAFVGQLLTGLNKYLQLKQSVKNWVVPLGEKYGLHLDVEVNPDDRPELGSVYLTVLGSSIEQGDCGVTGRGNRWNGLISPLRPMTIEGIAGKNTQNHPARLLTTVAQKISSEIHQELLAADEEVSCLLVGKVGSYMRELDTIHIQINSKRDIGESRVVGVASEWLDRFAQARTEAEFYSLA